MTLIKNLKEKKKKKEKNYDELKYKLYEIISLAFRKKCHYFFKKIFQRNIIVLNQIKIIKLIHYLF